MFHELTKTTIIILVGYFFLSKLPCLINLIEIGLNRYYKKPNSKIQTFLLVSMISIVAITYILFIYLAIPVKPHYRLILLSASLLFTMIRFMHDDYNSIGKTQLFNILNSALALAIVFEMFKILIF